MNPSILARTTSRRWWVNIGLTWLTCGLLWQLIQPAWADDLAQLKRPFKTWTDVVFGQVGKDKLLADIYRPDDSQPAPVVVLIHGGAWSAGDKWNMRDHGRELAQAGYVAVSINYRLAPDHKYPAQLDDCRRALSWLAEAAGQYQFDLQRVAVYGYSAGGQLAALLAADPQPDHPPIKVAVLGGAPCDLSFIPEDSRVIAHVLGGTRAQKPLVYREASPLTYCSGQQCPTFFFHGQVDLIVPPESSRIMCEKLSSLGVETEYFSVEKQGHLVTFIHPQARRAAIDFLDKHLKQDR